MLQISQTEKEIVQDSRWSGVWFDHSRKYLAQCFDCRTLQISFVKEGHKRYQSSVSSCFVNLLAEPDNINQDLFLHQIYHLITEKYKRLMFRICCWKELQVLLTLIMATTANGKTNYQQPFGERREKVTMLVCNKVSLHLITFNNL